MSRTVGENQKRETVGSFAVRLFAGIGVRVITGTLSESTEITIMNACKVEFSNNEFDVIKIFPLFFSIINPKTRLKISSELFRVFKPGGVILYYDFRYNIPANPNVVGINKNEINNIIWA